MIEVEYTSNFVREFKKLVPGLLEEALEKIDLFKNPKNHKLLKVHKLHGKLYGRYSFSVNYKTRIVFRYITPKMTALISIGDHDIYK